MYDVVIVGAGPAGSHLAYLLSKAGIKTALIDRMRFPRNKLCGGLLTQKTLDLLSTFYPKRLEAGYRPQTANVFYKGQQKASFILQSNVKTIQRYSFDAELLKIALHHGAHQYMGSALVQIDYTRKSVLLHDGTQLSFQYLIGADGALSTVRRLSGLPMNLCGFCIETNISWDLANEKKVIRDQGVGIYYGDFSTGYGWVFPNEENVVIGVGELTNQMSEQEIIKRYKTFINKIGLQEIDRPLGAYIPSGESITLGTPDKNEMCLIGDAAGLIDPITGEGLYYAFVSAKMAAEAIQTTGAVFSAYAQSMDGVVNRIGDANKMRDEIFIPHILRETMSSIQGAPKYYEQLIDNAIMKYTKTYREAFEDIKYFMR